MGESGDIFFPKLDEDRDMIPFDQLALDLLKSLGLTPDICQTEDEAREKTKGRWGDGEMGREGDEKLYPIYFFGSDTSGEKAFEEFFTAKEVLDNDSFINLGVVKNSKKRSIQEIDAIFDQLHTLFASKDITKAAIVNILKVYLPNFEHIETGKGLDSKM